MLPRFAFCRNYCSDCLLESLFPHLSFCPFFFAALLKNSQNSSATLSPLFASLSVQPSLFFIKKKVHNGDGRCSIHGTQECEEYQKASKRVIPILHLFEKFLQTVCLYVMLFFCCSNNSLDKNKRFSSSKCFHCCYFVHVVLLYCMILQLCPCTYSDAAAAVCLLLHCMSVCMIDPIMG